MCDMPVRDRTILVSGIGLAGVGIAFVVFCLRLIARLPCCGGQFGWDDWTMVLTMVRLWIWRDVLITDNPRSVSFRCQHCLGFVSN